MYIEQVFKKAHAKHMQGKYDSAVKLYREVLRINQEHLDANYLLGTLYAETGDLTMAKQFLEKADQINTTSPYIKVNLGNICLSEGNYDAAKEFFQQALTLKNDLPQAYFGLGNILEIVDNDIDGAAQHYQKVLQHLRKALQLTPNDAAMLQAAGKSLLKFGNSLALECFLQADLMNPRLHGIKRDLGIACVMFGRSSEAVKYLRQELLHDPDDTEAGYYLSIAEGKLPDSKLQQEYVRNQFDRYAASFDKVLVKKLEYTIPEKMIAFMAETLTPDFHFNHAADLGCGTGLFGIAVRNHVKHLTGIDLSSRMIELAGERNCYDSLFTGDIIEVLKKSATPFDLYAAMDVLVYFGAMEELFATLTSKAAPDALFVMSTESYAGENFILQNTGRYAHSSQYVSAVAAQFGCSLLADKEVHLRKDRGEWIMGHLYIIRLSSGSNRGN